MFEKKRGRVVRTCVKALLLLAMPLVSRAAGLSLAPIDPTWSVPMQITTNSAADVYCPVSVVDATMPKLVVSFGVTNSSSSTLSVSSVGLKVYDVFGKQVSSWSRSPSTSVTGGKTVAIAVDSTSEIGKLPFGNYLLEVSLTSGSSAKFRFAVRDPDLSLTDAFDSSMSNIRATRGNDYAAMPFATGSSTFGIEYGPVPTVQFGPYAPMNGILKVATTKKALDLVLLVDDTGSMYSSIGKLIDNLTVFVDKLLVGDQSLGLEPISDLRIKVVGFSDYQDYDFYGSSGHNGVDTSKRPWFNEFAFTSDAAKAKRDLQTVRNLCAGGSGNGGESCYEALYYLCKGWTQNVTDRKPTGYIETQYGFRPLSEASRAVLLFTDEPPHITSVAPNGEKWVCPGCETLTQTKLSVAVQDAGLDLTIIAKSGQASLHEAFVKLDASSGKRSIFVKSDLATYVGDVDNIRDLADYVSAGVDAVVVEPTISASVSGPGTLSFDWRDMSNAGENNLFTFKASGSTAGTSVCPQTNAWQSFSYDFADGNHTFQWFYRKIDDTETSILDCGQLRNVAWTWKRPDVPALIEISGTNELKSGSSAQYVANITFENGDRTNMTAGVVWQTWPVDDSTYWINSSGYLESKEFTGSDKNIQIWASYGSGSKTVTTNMSVRIRCKESPPAAPEVTASKGGSTDGVDVVWTNPSSDRPVTGFDVYRQTGSDGSFELVAENVSGTSWTDTGATPGEDYTYAVYAKSDIGTGEPGTASGWRKVLIAVDPASLVFGYLPSNQTVSVTHNAPWKIESTSGDHLSAKVSGDAVVVTVDKKNTTLYPRDGSVTLLAGEGTDHAERVTLHVSQDKRPAKPTKLEIVSGPTTLEGGSNGTFTVVATFEDGTKRDVTADSKWDVKDDKYGSFDAPGHLTTKETTDLDGKIVVDVSYSNSDYEPVTVSTGTTVDITFSRRLRRPDSLAIIGPDKVKIAETGFYTAIVHYNDNSTNDVTLAADAVWSSDPARPFADLAKGAASYLLTPFVGGTNVVLAVVYTEMCGTLSSGDELVEVEGSLTVKVPGTISLPVAVDAEDRVFATGASANGTAWYGQDVAGNTHDGADAAQSGRIFGKGESWMETTVTNAGDVSFWWKTSCEPTYDNLTFAVDGKVMAQTSGTTNGWQRLTFEIPDGTHTLRWTYAKDEKNDVGQDCGWVDQLVWAPLPAPSAQSGGVAIASISASDGTSADNIEVFWSPFDSRRPIYEYELSRTVKGSNDWTVVQTGNVLRFVDSQKTVLPGVDYTYRVRARNDAGWGEYLSDDGWRACSLSVSPVEIVTDCQKKADIDLFVCANADEWTVAAGATWLSASRSSATNATLGVAELGSLDPRTNRVTVTVGGASHPTSASVTVIQIGRAPKYDVGFVRPDDNWRTRLQVATNTVAHGAYEPVSVFADDEPLDISFGWTNRSEVAVAMPTVRFRLYVPGVDRWVSEWTVEGRSGEELRPGEAAWSGHWPFEPLRALKPGDYRLEAQLGPELETVDREAELDLVNGDKSDNIAIFRFAIRDPELSLADDVFNEPRWESLELTPGNDFAQVAHAAKRMVGDAADSRLATAVQFGPYVPMDGVKVSGSNSQKALDLVLLIDDSLSMSAGINGLVQNISSMVDELLTGDDPITDLRIKVVGFYDYQDYYFYGGITRPWFREYPFSTNPAELKNQLAFLRDNISGGSANDGESSFDALYYICKGWTQDVFYGRPTGHQSTPYGFRSPDEATRVVLLFTDEPPHVAPLALTSGRYVERNVPGCEGLTLDMMDKALRQADVHLMIVGDGRYQGDSSGYVNGPKYEKLVDMDPDNRKMVEPAPQDRVRGALAKMTGDTAFIRNLAGTVSSIVVKKVTKVEPTLSVNVKGSGDLTFWWRNDSTAGTNNTFTFICDNGVTNLVCDAGTKAVAPKWRKETLRVGNGSHTFKWSYGKIDYDGAVSDCGLIGDIVWTPDGPELALTPESFDIESAGAWDEHLSDNEGDVAIHGAGDQKVKVECNTRWMVVTNDVPDWISFVTHEGIGDGEIVFQVAENVAYEPRSAVITVRAGEEGDEIVEKTFAVNQAEYIPVPGPTPQILKVDVKPRWPWNEWVDIDFWVILPADESPVRIDLRGVNREGGEFASLIPKLQDNLYVEPYDYSDVSGREVVGGEVYAVCSTAGWYRISWKPNRSLYNNSRFWSNEQDVKLSSFAVELSAQRYEGDGADKVSRESTPVRLDARYSAASGVSIVTGVERIGHPTGGTFPEAPIDPVQVDTTELSNGWNHCSAFFKYFLKDYPADCTNAFYVSENLATSDSDRVCVINRDKVVIEGGVITNDTLWTADKIHLIRDNVYIDPKFTLTVADGARLKFCSDARIFVFKEKVEGDDGDDATAKYNIRMMGALILNALDSSDGDDTLCGQAGGEPGMGMDWPYIVDQNGEELVSDNGMTPIHKVEFQVPDPDGEEYVHYQYKYYTVGEKMGEVRAPTMKGKRFYGWYTGNLPTSGVDYSADAEELLRGDDIVFKGTLWYDYWPDTWCVEDVYALFRGDDDDDGSWRGVEPLVERVDASGAVLTLLPTESVVYDGKPHKPEVGSVRLDGVPYAFEFDTVYGDGDFTSAGEYLVSADLGGKYVNVPWKTFVIEPRPVEGCTVMLEPERTLYLPTVPKPKVSVILPDDVAGSVEVNANWYDAARWPRPGVYHVEVGLGDNFVGTLTNSFEILRNSDYDFTDFSADEISSDAFKAELAKKSWVIRFCGGTNDLTSVYWKDLIRNDFDFNEWVKENFVCWSDDVAGTPQIAVCRAQDLEHPVAVHRGAVTAEELRAFLEDAISGRHPIDASGAAVTLSCESFVYDGEGHWPDVTVELDGEAIDSDNYELEYSGNGVDAGTYTVRVVFNGTSYAGETEAVAYEVVPRALTSSDVTLDPESVVWDGTMHKPAVVADGISFTVDYGTGDFAAVGSYPVAVTAFGNCTGTVTKVFAVEHKAVDVGSVVIELDAVSSEVKKSKSGDAVDVRPNVQSVYDSVRTYAKGVDYDVVYSEPTFTTAGVYFVYADFKGGYSGRASVAFVVTEAAETVVTIVGDDDAVVETNGDEITVKPSAGKTDIVVDVPTGVDASKITVEISPTVESVKPNGAAVKVMSHPDSAHGVIHDITSLIVLPAADANGVVDLTKAKVRDEVIEKILDPKEKDTVVDLNPTAPVLQTVTSPGLFYQLREGTELGTLSDGDSTIGDGLPWKPKITVQGGRSGFYTIGVGIRK